MDDNQVMIRVVLVEILRHREPLRRELRRGRRLLLPRADFLTHVPVQREVMAEAGDQLAVIELALRTDFPAVEQTLILRLLGLEVEKQSPRLRVSEHNLPLLKPRHVQAHPIVVGNIGKHILVVADDVQGEK